MLYRFYVVMIYTLAFPAFRFASHGAKIGRHYGLLSQFAKFDSPYKTVLIIRKNIKYNF